MSVHVQIMRASGVRDGFDCATPGLALDQIRAEIGAETLDAVNLRDGRTMFVDDAGWEVEVEEIGPGHVRHVPVRPLKPINYDATALYLAICHPGTTHTIVGDVAIVTDSEFEE